MLKCYNFNQVETFGLWPYLGSPQLVVMPEPVADPEEDLLAQLPGCGSEGDGSADQEPVSVRQRGRWMVIVWHITWSTSSTKFVCNSVFHINQNCYFNPLTHNVHKNVELWHFLS